jgi:hypothetical protein
MWGRIKLVINGFTTGVFATLFIVTLALGMNPAIFFVAMMVTGGLALLGINHNI